MVYLSFMLFPAFALNCAEYSCDVENVEFPDQSSCIYTTANTHYLRTCVQDSRICSISQTDYNQTFCTYEDLYVANSLYPGDYCYYASDCYFTNDCVNNLCKGFPNNSSCNNDLDCDLGLFCESNYCKTQITVSSKGCLNDYDCVNNAACLIKNSSDSSQNQCTQYFSLVNGAYIGESNSWLCTSGFSYQNLCSTAPKSVATPYSCENNDQCMSSPVNNLVFNTTCECAFNPQGSSYCSLFEGDELFVGTFNYLQK